MPSSKPNALPSAQDFDFRNGNRLIAASQEIELSAARARSPADVYHEEEYKTLSKYADRAKAAINGK
jgi:hypothetical protein